MRIRIKILSIVSLIWFVCKGWVFGGAGDESLAFLKIGVGARAAALAGAYTSLCDDATAVYWNPAALMQLKSDREVTFMHNAWLAGINYEFLAVAKRIQNIVYGCGVKYLGVKDMEQRDKEGKKVDNSFDAYDRGISVSAAGEILNNLSVGATLKLLEEAVYNLKVVGDVEKSKYSGSVWAVDIGALYRILPQMQVSLVLVDVLSTKLKLNTEGFVPVKAVKAGASFNFGKGIFVGQLDYVDDKVKLLLGSEVILFNNILSLRAGYDSGFKANKLGKFAGLRIEGVSMGIGVVLKKFGVDYAFVPYGDLMDTHRISLTVKF